MYMHVLVDICNKMGRQNLGPKSAECQGDGHLLYDAT
jgi:hypothetical protein